MPTTKADHIVLTAPDLATGIAHIESALGVSLSPRRGGEHAGHGTHNALLNLGDDFYLEILAINPAAPVPSHPRLFGLSSADLSGVRVHHWIARSDDVHAAAEAAKAAGFDVGSPKPMARGDLHWHLTLRDDGGLAADGAFPSLIQWGVTHPHPVAPGLPDVGARLVRLEIRHPRAEELKKAFVAAGLDDARVVVSDAAGPVLSAVISTPTGEHTLS
ncbi:uncharacterized protein LOC62_02G002450 [Vanrija pseudolonga]|uniref:VOC domain-containing protein n=1 Tax=Vanrija pseudolonga TaxID=143232 RepID=A0AAF1BFZ0_9TREE|nr:hypothetical protein LOC62_02G002450 [Vanrija pseudolonga]